MFWKFWTHKEYLGTQALMPTSSLHKFWSLHRLRVLDLNLSGLRVSY